MDRYVAAAVEDMRAARDELVSALDEVGPEDWGRYVPYGERTLHDLLAHLASADHAWALAAQGLLKGEGQEKPPMSAEEVRSARERAIARGRRQPIDALRDEMQRRRQLLLSLYELLEPRHLSLSLPTFGERHNSVRERIWVGYHDRRHAADVRRALRRAWHPPRLRFAPAVKPVGDALSLDTVLYTVYSVDPAAWEAPSPLPGWSNRGLLAHIASGDWVFQRQLEHLTAHGRPAEWPDVTAGNARMQEERRWSNAATLVEEYLSMRHQTLRLLAQLKPKHLAVPMELPFLPEPANKTVLDYLTFFPRHEAAHAEQLRGAMRYARAAGGVGSAALPT
jgi:hypothetical protein